MPIWSFVLKKYKQSATRLRNKEKGRKNTMNNAIKEVLLTEEQIQAKVKELAAQISKDYADKDPVFVGVLKGVVIFFADMVRNVDIPCEIDFMSISSYSGANSTGRTEIRKDLSVDIKDRHVIILEDIFDTGTSLTFTVNHLLNKQPASLKVCTFLDKPERRRPGITLKPDYVGYTIPNEFVVGYGLDFNEHYRNLPYIGILKPEMYE
jgi:hypoxanthine phosphoribosyltransferase